MKQIKLLLIAALVTTVMTQSCLAKKNTGSFSNFYSQCRERDGFVTFNLPPSLAGLFVGKDDKDLKKLLSNINDVKFMIYDNKKDSVRYFADELKRNLPGHTYEDLLLVNSGCSNVAFKIHMKDNLVTELIIMAIDKDGLFAMSVEGAIELEKVKQLVSSVEVSNIVKKNRHQG